MDDPSALPKPGYPVGGTIALLYLKSFTESLLCLLRLRVRKANNYRNGEFLKIRYVTIAYLVHERTDIIEAIDLIMTLQLVQHIVEKCLWKFHSRLRHSRNIFSFSMKINLSGRTSYGPTNAEGQRFSTMYRMYLLLMDYIPSTQLSNILIWHDLFPVEQLHNRTPCGLETCTDWNMQYKSVRKHPFCLSWNDCAILRYTSTKKFSM
jgi:hypothetical protein